MKNVVIYARYSSTAQTEQSIDGQLRICREYAQRNNFNIVNEYIDRAITGTSDKRPAFLQMIKDSEKKEFQYILCYKLDRFSRNQYDSVVYKHKLAESGIKVLSATECISDNTEGKLVECVLEIMAEMYSIDLSQKVKRGIRESILKGNTYGGSLPIGYKQVNKKVYIDEDKSPIVKYLFQEYANGKSLRQITNELNNKHYTNNKNQPLKINCLRNALKNKKYIGLYTYEDIEKTDYYPAIIDKQIFDIVQDRLQANKKTPAKQKAKEEYILRGKVFCGYCGDSMYGTCGTSKQKTRHYYYTCKTRHTKHNCKKQNENKDNLEKDVVNAILNHILTPSRIKDIISGVLKEYENNITTQKIKEYEQRIQKVNNQLEKCFNMALNYTSEDLISRANAFAIDLENQRKDLQLELQKLKLAQNIKHTEKDLIKYFDMFINTNKKDIAYQKKIISLFLNRVYVFDNKFLIYCNVDYGTEPVSFDTMNEHIKNNSIEFYEFTSSNIKHNSPPKCLKYELTIFSTKYFLVVVSRY